MAGNFSIRLIVNNGGSTQNLNNPENINQAKSAESVRGAEFGACEFALLLNGGIAGESARKSQEIYYRRKMAEKGLKPKWQNCIMSALAILPEQLRFDACEKIASVIVENIPEAICN